MSQNLCIQYFSNRIYDLIICPKIKRSKFFNISMAKTTQKSQKVKIGFVTPSDHCAVLLFLLTRQNFKKITMLAPARKTFDTLSR